MFLRKFSIAISSSVLLLIPIISNTKATTFTDGEIAQVQHLQKEYSTLDHTSYNKNNIYQNVPHLTNKFRSGSLKNQYIASQLAYINYYRSLFGLPPITTNKAANNSAQKTAAIMAAINANPFVNQHGLPTDIRPKYINKSLWKLAQDTSETSNLNFNVNNQSAGNVVTDLITDHYNLSGSDTGHRAWLLSTRLSTTGIGAAYGSNGYRYSVQKVLNVDDLFKTPSQNSVIYPSPGVFPIELLKGKNIAWSLYLSNQTYTKTPKITITDVDTAKTYAATAITNYSKIGYGNFKTLITYSPNNTPIIAGHKYRVNIAGLDNYTFKLFQLGTNHTHQINSAVYQKSVQQDANSTSAFSKLS